MYFLTLFCCLQPRSPRRWWASQRRWACPWRPSSWQRWEWGRSRGRCPEGHVREWWRRRRNGGEVLGAGITTPSTASGKLKEKIYIIILVLWRHANFTQTTPTIMFGVSMYSLWTTDQCLIASFWVPASEGPRALKDFLAWNSNFLTFVYGLPLTRVCIGELGNQGKTLTLPPQAYPLPWQVCPLKCPVIFIFFSLLSVSKQVKPGFTNYQPQPKFSWALSKIERIGIKF